MARRASGAGTPPNRPSSPTGFTLVEIVVTLVILAIVAAVTVPAFRSSRPLGDLDYSAQRVEALLRLARDSAVRSATRVTVLIDSASSLVWLTTPTSTGAGSTGIQTTGEGTGLLGDAQVGSLFDRTGGGLEGALGAGTSLDLPLGVRLELTSARARFAFQPSGNAFPDSVFLVSSTGTRMVTVNPRTGHAIIF